jgi:hypothetical protein
MSEIKTELLQTSTILATQPCNTDLDNPDLVLLSLLSLSTATEVQCHITLTSLWLSYIVYSQSDIIYVDKQTISPVMNVKYCLSVSELAYDNSGPNTKINFDHVDKVK